MNLGNSAPTVTSVVAPADITLNGGTTKTVYVDFTAEDTNGFADLNDSSATVVMTNGAESRTSTGCAILSASGTTTQYNCTMTFQFYDSAGSWTVNASVSDLPGVSASNNTQASTVNALDFVEQDTSTMTWPSVTAGTNDNEASAPLVLTNGGNQNYATVQVKGYNATSGANVISADKFAVDDATAQTTGQTYAVEDTYTTVPTLALATHGASVTENAFFYVDLVSGLPSGTYTQASTWKVKVST